MNVEELIHYYNRFKFREDNFHDLMKYKINDVLLVSTFYDAFIFEQDGGLSELILGQYSQLNLSTAPRVTSVPTGPEALKMLAQRRFDLVITTVRMGELSPFEFSGRVKALYPDLPVLLVLSSATDLAMIESNRHRMGSIDDVFMWSGDSKIFLAMIKSIEDKKNLDYDARHGLVRVILLIEDSVEYYSMFLPTLYQEIMKQTQRLIREEATEGNRRLRMRIRPKVILVHDYESAEQVYRRYRDNLLCVITDVQYPRAGHFDPEAGVRFVDMVRRERCTIPIVVQSLDQEWAPRVVELGAQFLYKESPHLLGELHDFIFHQLGFGDFVFRQVTGEEESRAHSMAEFIQQLAKVSEESLLYHARNNHYSAWLIAHGEVQAARRIQPLQAEDFSSPGEMRRFLVALFDELKRAKNRGRIVDFPNWEEVTREQVVRLADGSLGGKGRGLAFLNALLYALDYGSRHKGVDVVLPLTAIIGTQEFDRFLERNRVGRDLPSKSDEEIRACFLRGELSEELRERLSAFVDRVKGPLAVRSSGLLEDSQTRPFAGIYRTLMLPNNSPDKAQRVGQLEAAVKLVYASLFETRAREYIESVEFTVEEEKMAVVIQEVVGAPHDGHFYPDISGVAQSFNFYPTGGMQHNDGIASVALGLGKAVVEGNRVMRFCPRYPKQEILSQRDLVGQSQKQFYALNLKASAPNLSDEDEGTVGLLDLRQAEEDGTLHAVGAVWDFENDQLVEGLRRPGPRVVNFGNILKYNSFPLAAVLAELLEIGQTALGAPVEIEFAANVQTWPGVNPRPVFYLLQIRPLNVNHEDVELEVDLVQDRSRLAVYSAQGLGNGILDDVRDVVFVKPERFIPTETIRIQEEISNFNKSLRHLGRFFMLVGPGRWGSKDRFLGVPVLWQDISQARLVVETDLENFRVEASQGTHFLHNVVGMNVGYMKVAFDGASSWLDWDYLRSLEVVEETEFCVHCRAPGRLVAKMDGKTGRIAVYKSEHREE